MTQSRAPPAIPAFRIPHLRCSILAAMPQRSLFARSIIRRMGGVRVPKLTVDLQEGFTGEPVTVLVNGKELYRGTPKTRQQIGFAESRSFDLQSEHLSLTVAMPTSGLSKSMDLDLRQDVWVGVNFSPEKSIVLRTASTPFGYL